MTSNLRVLTETLKGLTYNLLTLNPANSPSFRLSMTAAPMQILNQLPAVKGEDGMNLAFGAFACSPGPEFGASPR